MKLSTLVLPLVLAGAGLPAWAGPTAAVEAQRVAVKSPAQGLAGQQVASGDDVRREEAAVGRRLTPQELAELRQQVRQQWATAPEAGRSAELPSTERVTPAPAVKGEGLPATHTARP